MMRSYIDLSHTIHDGVITHKGLPAPAICDFSLARGIARANYDGGAEFQIGQITMVANTGTYIDCPSHRFAHGKDLSEVGLERFSGLDAVVVRVPHRERAGDRRGPFQNHRCRRQGRTRPHGVVRVLEYARLSHRSPASDGRGGGAFARARCAGPGGNQTRTTSTTLGSRNSRPVHTILLGHDILIVEHMRGLEQLPDSNFRFSAVPPKVKGMGTFPVRAFAEIG